MGGSVTPPYLANQADKHGNDTLREANFDESCLLRADRSPSIQSKDPQWQLMLGAIK
jgi:hypothetical protein